MSRRGAIPGALTLIWRRGAVAHLSMAGVIDLAREPPMREDAIFRIYSMTKPITSVALLMLLEEGKIALDDPVPRYHSRLCRSAGLCRRHRWAVSRPRPPPGR